MKRRQVVLGGVLAPCVAAGGPVLQAVADQSVQIEPDFESRTLRGVAQVRLARAGAPLTLDVGELEIEAVHGEPGGVSWQRDGAHLVVHASRASRLHIRFHGAPRRGLFFHPEAPQLHTIFATSQWMPCLDDPAQRAPLTLAVCLPQALEATGTGEPLPDRAAAPGRRWVGWRLATPMPSFSYGFAAGRFTRAALQRDGVVFEALGAPGFDRTDLLRLLADTPRMAAFYEGRAGLRYPGRRYAQVLLAGRAAQEAAGLALLGQAYGRRVLDEGARPWLGAHELAHQWWGCGVTNVNWNHIWLHEGLGSYLTAECLGACYGAQAFEESIGGAEDKLAELRRNGRDRPLLHPDWSRADASDRSVVYDKGTLFVHALRRRLGEARFAAALRDFTQRHWGRAVTSSDFEAAMQRQSENDLRPMFVEWVYGG